MATEMGHPRDRNSRQDDDQHRALWGSRWLKHLEASSEAYSNRFRSSRALAKPDNVLEVDIEPGHAHGRIVDRRGEIHPVDIAVKRLSEGEQEDVVTAIAGRADTLAALLDGEIPPNLIDAISTLEVSIFPGPSDLRPDCRCGEWAEPCVHAGALCVVIARLFDEDPFNLLTLRGLPRSELLSRVRSTRSEMTSSEDPHDSDAANSTALHVPRDTWAGWTNRSDLAMPPVHVDSSNDESDDDEKAWVPFLGLHAYGHQAGAPHTASSKRAANTEPDLDPDELLSGLKHDALIRSTDILTLGRDSMLAITYQADLARLAAETGWGRPFSEAIRAAGVSPSELDALADAWRKAGPEAVSVLTDTSVWSTDQTALSQARDDLVELGFERREVSLNYNSLGIGRSRLLVQSTSGHWYLISEGGPRKPRQMSAGPFDRPSELGTPADLPLD